MSGLVGLLETARGQLRQQVDRVVGAAYHEGMLYVAGLARAGAAFEVTFLEAVMLQAAEDEKDQAVAEKMATMLARKGWSDVGVVLAVDESETTTFDAILPPSDSAAEMQQMAHFEAARQLHREQDEFFSSNRKMADGRQEITVLQKPRADALRHTCEAAGVDLWALAAPPTSFHFLCEGRNLLWDGSCLRIADALLESDGAFHGWNESFSLALYGAALLVHAVSAEGQIFPLHTVVLSGWDYGRAARLVAAAWLLVLVGISAWDGYGWYAARQEAKQQQAELVLLAGDAQRMADDRAESAWMDGQEQALRQLTAEQSLATGLLVHLGKRNEAGIRLTELAMQRGRAVELKGEAVTFDALSAYMKGFERDRGFFPDGPVLLDSTRPEQEAADTSDAIHFSMELRLAGGEEDRNAGEGTP